MKVTSTKIFVCVIIIILLLVLSNYNDSKRLQNQVENLENIDNPEKKSLADLFPKDDKEFVYHDDWGSNNYKEVINKFKSNPLNIGDIVFLGNSITSEGKDWSKRFNYPNIKNRGIGGDVTEGVFARLDEIIFFKPKAVFLLIGINDLWNTDPETPSTDYISKNIIKISKKINKESSSTKIYIQTILPVEKEIYREKIIEINNILKLNEKNHPYSIIDLYSIFTDKNGIIKKDLTTDGIHLSEKGYDEWVKFVKPIINQLFNLNNK